MESFQRYKNLNHALRSFKIQVIESIPYAQNEMPELKTPDEIFRYLKARTKYKADPKAGDVSTRRRYKEDTELFQSLPTLMDDNVWGRPGWGDCDCFTIAALATLVANGYKDCGIRLVGRNRNNPVHIYAYVDVNGERKFLDLTNKYYNFERSYPYKQSIPLVLTQNDLQQMNLELAESGTRRRRRRRSVPVNSDYLYMPKYGISVPEHHLDEYHVNDFATMLSENGYSLDEITELSSKRSARKANKQEQKTAKKAAKEERKAMTARGQKKAAKTDKKKAKAELKRAKAEAKTTKANAKLTKADKSGGRFKLFKKSGGDEEGNEDGSENRIDKAIKIFDSVGNVVAKVRGKGGEQPEQVEPTPTNSVPIVPAPVTPAPTYDPTPATRYRTPQDTTDRDDDAEDPLEKGKKAKEEAIKAAKEKAEKEKAEKERKEKYFDIAGMEIPKPAAYVGGALLLLGGLKLAKVI